MNNNNNTRHAKRSSLSVIIISLLVLIFIIIDQQPQVECTPITPSFIDIEAESAAAAEVKTTTTTTNTIISIRIDIDCSKQFCNYFNESIWQGGVVPSGVNTTALIDFSQSSFKGVQRVSVVNQLIIGAINISAPSNAQVALQVLSTSLFCDELILNGGTLLHLLVNAHNNTLGTISMSPNSKIQAELSSKIMVLGNANIGPQTMIELHPNALFQVGGTATLNGTIQGATPTLINLLGDYAFIGGFIHTSGNVVLAETTVIGSEGNMTVNGDLTVVDQLTLAPNTQLIVSEGLICSSTTTINLQSNSLLFIGSDSSKITLNSINSEPGSTLYINPKYPSSFTNVNLLGTTFINNKPVSFFNGTISNLIISNMQPNFISLQNVMIHNISTSISESVLTLIADEYVEILNARMVNTDLVVTPYSTFNLTNGDIQLLKSTLYLSENSLAILSNTSVQAPSLTCNGKSNITIIQDSSIVCQFSEMTNTHINIAPGGKLNFTGLFQLSASKVVISPNSLLVVNGDVVGGKQSRLHFMMDELVTDRSQSPLIMNGIFQFDSGSGVILESVNNGKGIQPKQLYYIVNGAINIDINPYACGFLPNDGNYLYSFEFSKNANQSNYIAIYFQS